MSKWFRTLLLSTLYLAAPTLASLQAFGATWYIRPDGGSRYTQARVAAHLKGQCDGLADAPYPGSGVNQHCAFNDVRALVQDGTYTISAKWIIAGGDTVIIRGAIRDGVTYRIGWPNAEGALDTRSREFWGLQGDPYGSGLPAPPSGTAASHTRILGGNYENCHSADARTQLHGGFGVSTVLGMADASYVDIACLDITDFSECGKASQTTGCKRNPGALDDFATEGIYWSRKSTHDTLTDVRIHGLASAGMTGPTGDGTHFEYLDLIGNAGSGWNADSGNGTSGTGSLLVHHFNISWNGCVEQYPARQAMPYQDCTDDNTGGYGDGFGTATVSSNPGWTVVFDDGIASYNTQDGLDALHLTGAGSSTTVTHTLAFGNMGQQIKIGGNQAIVRNNVIYTSCNALREAIPGTPAGYNSRLTDFCRAADSGIVISVNDGATSAFEDNVVLSAGSTILEVGVTDTCKTPTCRIQQNRNILIGFPRSKANGYPDGQGEYPNPVYYTEAAVNAYRNPDGSFDGNTVYHVRKSWPCPNKDLHETNAHCGDPHLPDESWHRYGYGNTAPVLKDGKPVGPDGNGKDTHPAVKKALQTVVPLGTVLAAATVIVRRRRHRGIAL